MGLAVRDKTSADRDWIAPFMAKEWGGTAMVTRGRVHRTEDLPALVAEHDGAPVGLLHYCPGEGAGEGAGERACEIVSLDAMQRGSGVGSALLDALIERLAASGRVRLWVITTNDNLDALRFYQRRGFSLAAVHRGAVDEARRLKPSIPHVGNHGIPIRDEVELERRL